MNAPPNRVDELGFPIPPDFDGYPPPSRFTWWRSRRALRIVALLSLLILFGTALWSHFGGDVGKLAAAHLARSAEEKRLGDDLQGALGDLDTALRWAPNEPKIFELRAFFRQEKGDLNGSLEDYNRLLALAPKYASGYLGRSAVYQRLGRHTDAIADTNRAVELGPDWDHEALNARAYTRALAGMQLEEALLDAEKAVELTGGNNADYLDTRGYIHYLLGRYDAALADLERAVEQTETIKHRLLGEPPPEHWRHELLVLSSKRVDRALAVLYHHRGLIREKLGQTEHARADLQLADRLGYNPSQGIW